MPSSANLWSSGTVVGALHQSLSTIGFSVPKSEVDAKTYGVGTLTAVAALQNRLGLDATGVGDDATKAAIDDAVAAAAQPQYQVQGRVLLDNQLPAKALPLRLYTLGAGGTGTKLGETTTHDPGFSSIPQ